MPGWQRFKLFPFLLLVQLVFTTCVHAAEQATPANALIIYGSGGIANWDQEFNANLRDELGPDLGQYFTSEILPLINATPTERELFANSLALKYSNKDIGLIVSVLSEANDFVTEWVHLFAPNAAILRVLPSDDYLTRENELSNPVVILASAIDKAIRETATLLPLMLPNLQNIYLIGGAGEGDQAYMRRYRASLAALDLPYEFHYLSGLPVDELLSTLEMAPPNSAVMTTTYDIDRSGRPMRALILTQRMVAELSMPVIALANPQITAGAIGGNVTTASGYARSAMQLINGMFNGEYPDEPVIPENDYIFNARQLDRFDVNRNLLPANSVFVNETTDLWRDYGLWLLIGALVIVVQGLLILLLLAARKRSRNAETQLGQVHKMEALGTLAGGIAHDFNNILMSIMANAELLSFKTAENEEAQNRLGKILSASERAKSLVAQILMFSRQSDKAEFKPLNIKHLIEDSLEQITTFMPSTCKIKLKRSHNPASINGDDSQLHQVLMNLCINAMHAMDSKGVIEIDVDETYVDEEIPVHRRTVSVGHYVRVTIKDTGHGISESDLEHIFEPFFTTKPHGEGTGLGLALVYQIIKAHNGYIQFDSRPDVGTTVTLYLPVAGEKLSRPKKQPIMQLVSGNSEKILLVDDDELVLDANQDVFAKLGYVVTSFSNPIAALKEFQQNPDQFDLVFTDLSMPEMDGVRLISNIRQLKPDMPVILCTGYLDALEATDIEDLQVLKKPTSVIDISRAVDRALQRS